jgi:RNA polymerase sigma-70 factor (ECF subfamily)
VATRDDFYRQARAEYGAVLSRVAYGYEGDPERRADLLQDIHIELWRSLDAFDGRCSLKTWVYRVAHNVAASHIARERRRTAGLISLEDLAVDGEAHANRQYSISQLLTRIHRLHPPDRQIMLLYLEDESAAAIAEVTGLSPQNVATRIHYVKRALSQNTKKAAPHAQR